MDYGCCAANSPPVAVAEFYEATSDCEAIVKAQCKVELAHRAAWFTAAAQPDVASQGSSTATGGGATKSNVAVAEFYEATSDCEAIVKAQCEVELAHRAAGRSLARLVNCYGRSTPVDTSVGASLSRDLLIVP